MILGPLRDKAESVPKECTQLPLGSLLEFSILNIHMEKVR